MSEVKTYAVNCNDAWLNTEGDDISGSYVKYKDHQEVVSALEAKCAALAAENAGLKAAHPQPFGPEMMKALDAYEKHQDEVPETGMLDAFFILRDSIRVDTTATDAFLSEVLAQGVEMFAQWCRGERDFTLIDEDIADAAAYDECVKRAEYFSAQLRKGVEQK